MSITYPPWMLPSPDEGQEVEIIVQEAGMPERREFDVGDSDVEIIMNPDGSLTIETCAEYGDSEIGWGGATKTVYLNPDQVAAFRKFLEPQ